MEDNITDDGTISTTNNVISTKELGKLALALSKAQGEFEKARKNSSNPFFKSKYADLAEVISATRPALSANELAILQFTSGSTTEATVTTRLIHSSGQWIESSVSGKPARPEIQAQGGIITYLRRYSMSAILSISQEDDDSEGAMGRGQTKERKPTLKLSDKQVQSLMILLADHSDIEMRINKKYKRLENISASEFDNVVSVINKLISDKG